MRQRLRPQAVIVAAVAIAAAVPAVAATAAHAEEAAPDLVISTLPSATPKPGEVYDESVILTNNGTAAADGVAFRIRLTRGLDFPAPVKGCTYSTVEDQVRQALCELDTVIEPGASVTTPVRFKALPKALMESVEYGTGRTGEVPGEGYGDSYRRLTLTADSSADLAATGDRATARPGSTVTVRATLRNDGPGWIQNQESDDQVALMVTIPPGTVATEVPEDCAPFDIDGPSGPSAPGKPRYVCWPADHTLEVGQSLTYAFVLHVKDTAKDTEGEVRATSVYGIHPAFDKNPANDTARLGIDVPGGDDKPSPSPSDGTSGGNGSGDGGSGNDGNHPQGQTVGGSGTTASATTDSTAAGSSTGGSTDVSAEGHLASTGSDGTTLVAAAAAAVTALGGLLLLAVRRRSATKSS